MTSRTELEEGQDIALGFGRFFSQGGEGVLPVAVQDVDSGEVLVVAHANRAAVEYTLRERVTAFWSLPRDRLWVKGETSLSPVTASDSPTWLGPMRP